MPGYTLLDFIRKFDPVISRPEYANTDPHMVDMQTGEYYIMDYFFLTEYPLDVPLRNLWSCNSQDGLIYPGRRFADTLCYYVSKIPWTDEELKD
jgi:hypothetical protein